jgi:hypothetical protein
MQWFMPVNPAIQVKIGRTAVRGQPGQKVSDTPISTNKKVGIVARICHLIYLSKAKMAPGMAQVVEWLPSKYKTLSSNPNTTKKTKNQQE